MADNTTINAGTGGDVIASDDIAGIKHQRVKVEFGADGSATDVSASTPLPVAGGQANPGGTSSSTTFTAVDVAAPAPDGTGALIATAPTSGSATTAFAVADGLVASVFLVKGLTASQTTLTVYFEGSANSTNGTDGDWVELKQRRTGTQPGVETADYKTQANGYFRGNCAGFRWLRARLLGTPFAAGVSVQMFTSAGQGATFFNSGLPGSGATIGNVGAAPAATATLSNVTAAAADTTLMAANTSRAGLVVFNDSTGILYLKFGTGASTSSHTLQVPGGGYYEMPAPIYRGQVNGYWAAAGGTARVTEFV